MEPSRDNPLVRFSAFWLALCISVGFAVILGVIALFNRGPKTDLEAAPAQARYETRDKVFAAQEASLPAASIEKAIPLVAKELAASKPAAVEKPEQVVPGSPTALKAAESAPAAPAPAPAAPATEAAPAPAETPAAPAEAPAAPAPAPGPTSANDTIDSAIMNLGKAQFIMCSACHGQEGEGGGAAPPLAGSEWVNGPVENLVRIQLRGLKGPIKVKGADYNFPAGMAPMSYQSDKQIAAVLTYARNSFGNKASAVTPEQVAALRGEVGKPQLTADELIMP